MKMRFNRFAILPFHCTDCHRLIWLESYRKASVFVDLSPCMPITVNKKICNECLTKYNVK